MYECQPSVFLTTKGYRFETEILTPEFAGQVSSLIVCVCVCVLNSDHFTLDYMPINNCAGRDEEATSGGIGLGTDIEKT